GDEREVVARAAHEDVDPGQAGRGGRGQPDDRLRDRERQDLAPAFRHRAQVGPGPRGGPWRVALLRGAAGRRAARSALARVGEVDPGGGVREGDRGGAAGGAGGVSEGSGRGAGAAPGAVRRGRGERAAPLHQAAHPGRLGPVGVGGDLHDVPRRGHRARGLGGRPGRL
ncbi:MAG: hypothetical protein AVDCRST_MAG25-311, partial [uncultured Rubrobacteraceae bacterium]